MTSTLFLEKALDTLEVALKDHANNPEHLVIRDGVIQRFEYCFELSVKLLKKILSDMGESKADLETLFYKDIIRLAASKGLVESPKDWFKYRESRNKTSHAYSNEVANEVFDVIEPFLSSAKALLNKLKSIDH